MVSVLRSNWLKHLPPAVVVPEDSRVKVWRYSLGSATLLAFERNITYHMGEDLQQSADNTSLAGRIAIDAHLPEESHAYDLRSGEYLGENDVLTLSVSADLPTLVALTSDKLPDGDPIALLHQQEAP